VLSITVTNQQSALPIDSARIERAVRIVLGEKSIGRGRVGVAVVDDAAIAELHGRYLQDGKPTDVLSFGLGAAPGYLEGEVVVSAQRAAAVAPRYGWAAEDELLLYVIHGALHLVGYDDTTPRRRAEMRRRERAFLARFGVEVRYAEAAARRGARPAARRK
jgi:probable rRNA maturation factor